MPFLETHLETMGIHTIPPYSQSPNLNIPVYTRPAIPHYALARPLVLLIDEAVHIKVRETLYNQLFAFSHQVLSLRFLV